MPERFSARVARNAVYLLLNNAVVNGCLFASNIILANTLTTETYGMVTLVVSLSSVFVLLADLGVSTGTTKLVAEALGGPPGEKVGAILSWSLRTTLIAAFALTVVSFGTARPLSRMLGHEEIVPYVKLAAAWVIPYSIMRYSLALFNGFQDMKYSFWVNLPREIGRLIALAVVVAIGISVERVVIGWTLALYLTVLIFIGLMKKFVSQKGLRLDLLSGRSEKGWMTYSLYLYLPFLGIWAMPYLMNALVAKFGSLSQVSYFTVAFSLTTLPFFLFLPLSNALLPAFSERFGKKDGQGKSITFLFSYVGIANLFLLSILCFYRHFILTSIYGRDYEAAETLLIVLSFAVFFESFKIVADPLLKGTRHARLSMIIEIFRFLVLLTGGVVLIRHWGMWGASLILLAVYFWSSLLKLWLIERHLGVSCLKTFFYSLTWSGLLLVCLLLRLPSFLFFPMAVALMIAEGIVTRQDVKTLWSVFGMTTGFHRSEA